MLHQNDAPLFGRGSFEFVCHYHLNFDSLSFAVAFMVEWSRNMLRNAFFFCLELIETEADREMNNSWSIDWLNMGLVKHMSRGRK